MATTLPRRRDADRWVQYLYILPCGIYIIAFQLYPLVQQVFISFTDAPLLNPRGGVFVGAENYVSLLSSKEFATVIRTTALYTFFSVVLAVFIGVGVALLMNTPFPGRPVVRSLVTIPWAAPPVAVALIFTWIYNAQYGVFNQALRALGSANSYENWLDSYHLALPAVLIATVWQLFPFVAVVVLAALQGVSQDQREAAVMDGASSLSVFSAVTWPTIKPTVMLLSLFLTVWSLRRFDLIWLLTQGGPIDATNTLVVELYRKAFVYRSLGQAAAVGVIGLIIASFLTAIYLWLSQRNRGEAS